MRRRALFDFSRVPREKRTLIMACILFWSILSYLLISRYVVGAAEVVGHSMEPTLMAGERCIVNRAVYRFFQPQRGDILVARFPGDEESASVKRVIALPYEKVEIKDGRVYVNDLAMSEPYLPRTVSTEARALSGHAYRVEGQCYFLLGDNRKFSADSRSFGAVPLERIEGRVDW